MGKDETANGGAVYSIASTVNVTSSVFFGNIGSGYGGCIYIESSVASISNCEFDGNSAQRGGAIYCHLSQNESPDDINLNSNRFGVNNALAGTDLCASTQLMNGRIQAKNSQFHYHPQSDFCVSPKTTFLLSGFTSATTPIQTDVYVSPMGSDENDGLTADTPFKTIHYALERLLGNSDEYVTIHLAPGRYSPSLTGERFPLPLLEYISLQGESQETTILDAEDGSRILYGFYEHFLTISDLTFTGGSSTDYGGGFIVYSTDVMFNQCQFTQNAADGGGGGYVATGSTNRFYSCVFDHNTSEAIGGGLFIRDSNPTFFYCTFRDNSCSGQGGGVAEISSSAEFNDCSFLDNVASDGGGLYSFYGSSAYSNCSFEGNTGRIGGGIYIEATSDLFTDCAIQNNSAEVGGGFFSLRSLDTLTHCNIESNHAKEGGGGKIEESSKTFIRRCTLSNNQSDENGGALLVIQAGDSHYPEISNCLMESNSAGGSGGALRIESQSDSMIMNCTFSVNTAGQYGGAISASNTNDVSVTNSILWNNMPDVIHTESSVITISFSNISGGYAGDSNIASDPLFVGLADFRLKPESPCIDAGTDENAPMKDIDGNFRPECGSTDIGAYEFYSGPLESRVYIKMPTHLLYPGMTCSCTAIIWNAGNTTISNHPFFAVLEILGHYYFAPDFNEFGSYQMDIPPGKTWLAVLPAFEWPDDIDAFSGAKWYACVTNPEMDQLLWNLAIWEFGWSQ